MIRAPRSARRPWTESLKGCEVGDIYSEDIGSGFGFENSTLLGGTLWISCDIGYKAAPCEKAYEYVLSYLPCFDSQIFISQNITVEQLESEACPAECQERYDYVLENCQPGDFIRDIEVNTFWESLLYHKQNLYKRRQCNVGYQPSNCAAAVDALVDGATKRLFIVEIVGFLPACFSEDNQDTCSPECMNLIDSVVSSCSDPTSVFSPSRGHSDLNYRTIPFEGRASLESLGLNPSSDAAFYALSELCWEYYVSMEPREALTNAPAASFSSLAPMTTSPVASSPAPTNATAPSSPAPTDSPVASSPAPTNVTAPSSPAPTTTSPVASSPAPTNAPASTSTAMGQMTGSAWIALTIIFLHFV